MTAVYLQANTSFWDNKHPHVMRAFGILYIASILNQAVLLMSYIPATAYALEYASPNGIISWALQSPLHYEERQKRIFMAAESCHIPVDRSGTHVVIDDTTYLALKTTYQPMRAYFGKDVNESPQKFFALLHKWQSSGLITDCSSLSKEIMPLATQSNGFCCMSKEQIDGFWKIYQ